MWLLSRAIWARRGATLAVTMLAGTSGLAAGPDATYERIGIENGDFVIEQRYEGDGLHLHFRVHGIVEFSDNDRSILSMPPDAFALMDARMGAASRRLKVSSTRVGKLEYHWVVHGKNQSYDDAGSLWMDAMLGVVADVRKINGIREEQRALEAEIRDIESEEQSLERRIQRIRALGRSDVPAIPGVEGKRRSLKEEIEEIYAEKEALEAKIESVKNLDAYFRENLRRGSAKLRQLLLSHHRLVERDLGTPADVRESLNYLSSGKRDLREAEKQHADLRIEARIAEAEAEIAALQVEKRVVEIEAKILALDATSPRGAAGDQGTATEDAKRIAKLRSQIETLAAENRVAELKRRIGDLRISARIAVVEEGLSPKLAALKKLLNER